MDRLISGALGIIAQNSKYGIPDSRPQRNKILAIIITQKKGSNKYLQLLQRKQKKTTLTKGNSTDRPIQSRLLKMRQEVSFFIASAIDDRRVFFQGIWERLVIIGLRPLYGLFCAMRYDSRTLWRFWAKRGYGRVVHGCKHAQ